MAISSLAVEWGYFPYHFDKLPLNSLSSVETFYNFPLLVTFNKWKTLLFWTWDRLTDKTKWKKQSFDLKDLKWFIS